VDDLHLGEDSGTIVGNNNLSLGVLDHLIHASRAERSADDIGDSLGGDDVGGSDVLGLLRLEFTGSLTCAHIIVILNFNCS